MDVSSIATVSLYSPTHHRFLNFPLKPRLTASPIIPKSISLHPKLQALAQFHATNPINISPKSIPNLSINRCLSPNPEFQRTFWKFLSEKVVILLVGSFIFVGSFRARPVLALSAQESSSCSDTGEERGQTQYGGSEDEEMYMKILENDPKNVEALKVVLYGKMRKGKTKEAVRYVERLIDVEPGEVEWRLLQALCYEMLENFSKSKRLFREILEKRPLSLRALHGLAMVMHKNHEGSAIFEMLNKALELARRKKRVPEERNIRILIAQMHVVKGNLEEGLKNFQVLVDENPRDFRPYLCQGIIYSLLDKKKEAEEQFETYRSLVLDEFPQRGYLDDVVLAAKTNSKKQLQKEFRSEFSNRK